MAATESVMVKAGWSATDGADDHSYTVNYEVTVSDQSDGPWVVLAYTGGTDPLPLINATLSAGNDTSSELVCVSRTPTKKTEHADIWVVACRYANRKGEEGQERDENGEITDDPLRWRKQLDWGFVSRQKPIEKALWVGNSDGSQGVNAHYDRRAFTPGPLVNSAEQPMPQQMMDDNRAVVRITRWEGLVRPQLLRRFKDAINDKAFSIRQFNFPDAQGNLDLIFDMKVLPFEAKMRDIRLSEVERTVDGRRQIYFRMTYELMIDVENTWQPQYPDKGRVMSGVEGQPDQRGGFIGPLTEGQANQQRILDAQGRQMTGDVLLDGWGKINPPKADTIYSKWDVYKHMDFAELTL